MKKLFALCLILVSISATGLEPAPAESLQVDQTRLFAQQMYEATSRLAAQEPEILPGASLPSLSGNSEIQEIIDHAQSLGIKKWTIISQAHDIAQQTDGDEAVTTKTLKFARNRDWRYWFETYKPYVIAAGAGIVCTTLTIACVRKYRKGPSLPPVNSTPLQPQPQYNPQPAGSATPPNIPSVVPQRPSGPPNRPVPPIPQRPATVSVPIPQPQPAVTANPTPTAVPTPASVAPAKPTAPKPTRLPQSRALPQIPQVHTKAASSSVSATPIPQTTTVQPATIPSSVTSALGHAPTPQPELDPRHDIRLIGATILGNDPTPVPTPAPVTPSLTTPSITITPAAPGTLQHKDSERLTKSNIGNIKDKLKTPGKRESSPTPPTEAATARAGLTPVPQQPQPTPSAPAPLAQHIPRYDLANSDRQGVTEEEWEDYGKEELKPSGDDLQGMLNAWDNPNIAHQADLLVPPVTPSLVPIMRPEHASVMTNALDQIRKGLADPTPNTSNTNLLDSWNNYVPEKKD